LSEHCDLSIERQYVGESDLRLRTEVGEWHVFEMAFVLRGPISFLLAKEVRPMR